MSHRTAQLERFLTKVHRRLILSCFLEAIGGGMMIGSIAAMPLVGILAWRGRSTLELLAGMLVAGLVAGVLWQARRCPSRLDAAQEADRQLGLADLMSTAWLVRASDDPWVVSVLARAEQRSAMLWPGDVVVRRYGGRAWSGIGLTIAFTIGLAMLGVEPHGTVAAGAPLIPSLQDNRSASDSPYDARHDAPSPGSYADSAATPVTVEPADASGVSAGSSGNVPGNATGTENGKETGEFPSQSLRDIAADGSYSHAGGMGAGGVRASAKDADARRGFDLNFSGGQSMLPEDQDSLPWDRDTWPTDRMQAQQPIESGDVPDAYRDLVRDYFDRHRVR